jgi:hypothetical protein
VWCVVFFLMLKETQSLLLCSKSSSAVMDLITPIVCINQERGDGADACFCGHEDRRGRACVYVFQPRGKGTRFGERVCVLSYRQTNSTNGGGGR